DSQGKPIPSAAVTLGVESVSGPNSYALAGTVPASITKALVQICVNECGSRGTNQMNIYGYQYSDSGGSTALDFSNGLSGWLLEGGRTMAVQLVGDSNSNSLAIQATAEQQGYVNSPVFAVKPGSPFTLMVQAQISAASAGSGYFALIFLSDKEVSRVKIP